MYRVKGYGILIFISFISRGMDVLREYSEKSEINDCFRLIFGPCFDLFRSESTDYSKVAKLHYFPSGFRCRIITASLLRLY